VDIRYFIAAAFLNSAWRISHTAWTCLMVEDAEERHLVHIWTWIMIFGVCSAFFSPIGGWLVNRFGLVPVTRGLFLFGSGMIGFKAVYLYFMSHETARGKQRLIETKHTSLFGLMAEYGSVFPRVFSSKPIMLALSLMIVTNIYNTVSGSFWGVLFTSKLGFADSEISIYIALRSIFMTVCFFLLGSRFTNISRYKLPLWLGFGAFFSSQAILIWMPPHSIPLVVISVLLEGIASAFVSPMTESLLSLSLESNDRARVSAVVYLILIVVSSPFGWIAGQLSAIDRSLPFALNMGLFLVGALVVTFFKNSVTGKDKQLLV
jgi:Na+/melibiose symporter-like transporter